MRPDPDDSIFQEGGFSGSEDKFEAYIYVQGFSIDHPGLDW